MFDLPILQASQAELPFLKGFEAGPLEHPKSLDDDIDMMAFTVIIILYIYILLYYIVLYYIRLFCIISYCYYFCYYICSFYCYYCLLLIIVASCYYYCYGYALSYGGFLSHGGSPVITMGLLSHGVMTWMTWMTGGAPGWP